MRLRAGQVGEKPADSWLTARGRRDALSPSLLSVSLRPANSPAASLSRPRPVRLRTSSPSGPPLAALPSPPRAFPILSFDKYYLTNTAEDELSVLNARRPLLDPYNTPYPECVSISATSLDLFLCSMPSGIVSLRWLALGLPVAPSEATDDDDLPPVLMPGPDARPSPAVALASVSSRTDPSSTPRTFDFTVSPQHGYVFTTSFSQASIFS